MTEGGDRPYPEVGSPDFPAIERRVLARWKAEGTFERSVSARPPERDWVFYDGPPFANGLPHTATSSPATSRMSCPGTRPCGATGSTSASDGTATGSRPRWRPSASWAWPAGPRPGIRHRRVQPALPPVGRPLHAGVGGHRHPPGPLGRLRQRLQDHGPDLYGVGHVGLRPAAPQGLVYERTGSCRTHGGPRRPCRTSRSASTTPPGPARTRPSPWPSTWCRRPAIRGRCACWPGPPPRGRCRRTWCWRWAVTSPTQ